MVDATVILATYDRCVTLAQALESLARQEVPVGFTWEALIVDNNSRDATRRVVESRPEISSGRFRYIFEGRQGKTHALNAAIAQAKGEVLVFTDDDVTLDASWLANLVKRVRESDCAAAGGRIVPVWTEAKPRWLETDGPYRLGSVIVSLDLGAEPCIVTDRLPLGANMAIKAETLNRLGGFRPDLGPTVGSEIRGEDSEICHRMMNVGEQLIYVPDAVVYHPVDKRRLDRKYFQKYYFAQGRAITREEGIPIRATRYCNVPRYLIRGAGVKFVKWMVSFGVSRRFYHKLQFYYAVGRIVEARMQLAGGRPAGFNAARTSAHASHVH